MVVRLLPSPRPLWILIWFTFAASLVGSNRLLLGLLLLQKQFLLQVKQLRRPARTSCSRLVGSNFQLPAMLLFILFNLRILLNYMEGLRYKVMNILLFNLNRRLGGRLFALMFSRVPAWLVFLKLSLLLRRVRLEEILKLLWWLLLLLMHKWSRLLSHELWRYHGVRVLKLHGLLILHVPCEEVSKVSRPSLAVQIRQELFVSWNELSNFRFIQNFVGKFAFVPAFTLPCCMKELTWKIFHYMWELAAFPLLAVSSQKELAWVLFERLSLPHLLFHKLPFLLLLLLLLAKPFFDPFRVWIFAHNHLLTIIVAVLRTSFFFEFVALLLVSWL